MQSIAMNDNKRMINLLIYKKTECAKEIFEFETDKESHHTCGWFRDTFLPATKAMPKEMLPILDKPTIQYIVEEAARAGIEDIIIVTGKHKRAIEDHFDNQKN